MNSHEIMAFANELIEGDEPFSEGFGGFPVYRICPSREKHTASSNLILRYTDGRRVVRCDYEMVGAVAGMRAEQRVIDGLHTRLDRLFDAFPARIYGRQVLSATLRVAPWISDRKGDAAMARARFSLAEEQEGEMCGMVPFFPTEEGGWVPGKGLFDLSLSFVHPDGTETEVSEAVEKAKEGPGEPRVRWSMMRDVEDYGQNLLLRAANAPLGGKFDLVMCAFDEGGKVMGPAIKSAMRVDIEDLSVEDGGVVFRCCLMLTGWTRFGSLVQDEMGIWHFSEECETGEIKRKEGIA